MYVIRESFIMFFSKKLMNNRKCNYFNKLLFYIKTSNYFDI